MLFVLGHTTLQMKEADFGSREMGSIVIGCVYFFFFTFIQKIICFCRAAKLLIKVFVIIYDQFLLNK